LKAEKIILTVDRSFSGDNMAGSAAMASSEAIASSELVALVTLAVALLALIASFYFGWLQRRHFQLSSKAMLDFTYSTHGALLELENHGFGPATLTKFTAKVDGEKPFDLMTSEGVDAYVRALLRGIPVVGNHRVATLSKNTIIGAGRKSLIISVDRTFTGAEQQVIFANFKTINVRAKYTCIYGKEMTANLRGFT